MISNRERQCFYISKIGFHGLCVLQEFLSRLIKIVRIQVKPINFLKNGIIMTVYEFHKICRMKMQLLGIYMYFMQ